MFENVAQRVQPSASVVILSSYLQPLVELADEVLFKVAVNIRVEELWFREYQVLDKRTHPMMNMNGASGYILSFIYIG